MRAIPSILSMLLLALVVACASGGDDDDGGDDPGDGAGADGGGDQPDGAPLPYEGLGESCTGEGQGDCPDGFECVPLPGASWCSKRCTAGMNAPCQVGYEGPGEAGCIIGVSTEGSPAPEFFICGVICDDPEGTIGCENCDGTCPADLECTGPIMTPDEEVIGMACQ